MKRCCRWPDLRPVMLLFVLSGVVTAQEWRDATPFDSRVDGWYQGATAAPPRLDVTIDNWGSGAVVIPEVPPTPSGSAGWPLRYPESGFNSRRQPSEAPWGTRSSRDELPPPLPGGQRTWGNLKQQQDQPLYRDDRRVDKWQQGGHVERPWGNHDLFRDRRYSSPSNHQQREWLESNYPGTRVQPGWDGELFDYQGRPWPR